MKFSFEQHRIIGGNGADDEYWRGLERGVFQLQRCAGCRRWMWPAHLRCGRCGSWEFDWVPLEPRGTIFSWTRTFYSFDRVTERRDDLPYVTAVVEVPAADGARVIGVLRGDESGLKVGVPVRGAIDPPCEKTKWYPSIRWQIERAGASR